MKPHEFWQDLHETGSFPEDGTSVGFYPVTLDDGRQLRLPIRPLSDGDHALASLIINQASFTVLGALADDLAAKLKSFEPDVVVGLPTLGLTLASEVARRLGHSRYVPLGTSRKFWYLEELSVPMSSVTTQQEKRLYIDPRMLPLLEGRRVALIECHFQRNIDPRRALPAPSLRHRASRYRCGDVAIGTLARRAGKAGLRMADARARGLLYTLAAKKWRWLDLTPGNFLSPPWIREGCCHSASHLKEFPCRDRHSGKVI